MNLVYDIKHRLLFDSHPYLNKNLCATNRDYLFICSDEEFLYRLAKKWCFPDKSVERISKDLPNITYNQIAEIALFTYPLPYVYADNKKVNSGSIGKYNPISLYYQACLRGYSESRCEMFIEEKLRTPITFRLELEIAEVASISLIAVKFSHISILTKLRKSLMRQYIDKYDNKGDNVGLSLFETTYRIQAISFSLAIILSSWLGIGNESDETIDYFQDVALGTNIDEREIFVYVCRQYFSAMLNVGIGLDLIRILDFLTFFLGIDLCEDILQDNFDRIIQSRTLDAGDEVDPTNVIAYIITNTLPDEAIQNIYNGFEINLQFTSPKDTQSELFLENIDKGIFSYLWTKDMNISYNKLFVYRPDLIEEYSNIYDKPSLIRTEKFYNLLQGLFGEEELNRNNLNLYGYNPETVRRDKELDLYPDY